MPKDRYAITLNVTRAELAAIEVDVRSIRESFEDQESPSAYEREAIRLRRALGNKLERLRAKHRV